MPKRILTIEEEKARRSKASKKYYLANKEALNERNTAYNAANKDRLARLNRHRYQIMKEGKLAADRATILTRLIQEGLESGVEIDPLSPETEVQIQAGLLALKLAAKAERAAIRVAQRAEAAALALANEEGDEDE